MAAFGDDPEGGLGDGAVHVDGHFDGVEGVAVAVDDQGRGGDFGKLWRCEVQVVVAVFQGAALVPQVEDLLVAEFVAFAHAVPLALRHIVGRYMGHHLAGLFGKVHRGADQNHGGDAVGLQGGHVEEGVAAHAEADGAALLDAQVVEEREEIQGVLAVVDGVLRVGGAAVAAGVRGDKLVVG